MQFNIVSIWQEMGFIGRLVTVTLATMSIWSIGAIIERSLTFFLQRSRSRRFAADLAGHLSAGRVKEAFKQASETNSYLGNLVESGLKEWLKPDKLGHEERLHHTRNAMERATLRGVQRLKRGQGVLGTVGPPPPSSASSAPSWASSTPSPGWRRPAAAASPPWRRPSARRSSTPPSASSSPSPR